MEIVYKCTNTKSCHRDNKRLSEPKDGFIDMCGSFGECQHKEKMILIGFEELSSLKQENERLKNNIEERKHAQFEQQAYTAQLQQQNKELVEALKTAKDAELFLGYLVDNCEGETITEEFLMFKTSDMLSSQWYKDRVINNE